MSLENWMDIAAVGMKDAPWSWAFFIPFICFTNYTLLNLVTAVVVENVLLISQNEQVMEKKRDEQRRYDNIRLLKELFADMDEDGNGELSLEEFQAAMDDPTI